MRITLHPLAGCGLILLFSWIGAQSQERGKEEPKKDPRVEAFRRSYEQERKQLYELAITALDEVPQGNRDYLVAMRLGWLRYLTQDHAASLRSYESAAGLNAESIEPKLGQLTPLLVRGQYADAEKAARSVISQDAKNYTANLRLAYLYRIQNKLTMAERITREMVALYPSDRDWLIEHALTLTAQNKSKDATPYYQAVLLVAPNDEIARRAVANVRTTGKSSTVADTFRKSLELEAEAKYADALSSLSKVQPTKPFDAIYHARIGWLNYLLGNHAESRAAYDKAEKASPKAVEPLLGSLLPLLAQREYASAEETARRALKLVPGNYLASMRLGYALRMQEKYSEAEKSNAAALSLYPSDYTLCWEQALVFTAQSRPDDAAKLYAKMRVLNPDFDPTATKTPAAAP